MSEIKMKMILNEEQVEQLLFGETLKVGVKGKTTVQIGILNRIKAESIAKMILKRIPERKAEHMKQLKES